jgi:hypothetical protein
VLYVLKAERSEQGERHSQADPESALWIGSVRGHKLAAELLDGVTHSSYFFSQTCPKTALADFFSLSYIVFFLRSSSKKKKICAVQLFVRLFK